MMGLGSTAGHHVPDEMAKDLGAGFNVMNFAVEAATAIKSVSTSYAATAQYKAALAFNPDIVLFWFGGNDSFAGTWDAHKGEFEADYTALIKAFQALPSHPKTFLVRLWVFVNTPTQQTVIDKEILPIIDKIGADTGSYLIDYRKAFQNHPEYFPDGMHPNNTGTLAIGKLFADSVTMALSAAGGDGGSDAAALPDAGGSETSAGSDAVSNDVPVTMGSGGAAGGTGGVTGAGTGGATVATGGASGSSTGSGGHGTAGATSSGGCSLPGGGDAHPTMLLIATLAILVRSRRRSSRR